MHYNVTSACILGLRLAGEDTMKQLTIRGVDSELHHALSDQARQHGLSINRYVLSLLRKATGLGNGDRGTPVIHHDLDHLAGTWAQEDYAGFQEQLAAQRGLDEGLWR